MGTFKVIHSWSKSLTSQQTTIELIKCVLQCKPTTLNVLPTCVIRHRRQISLFIISEFERINFYFAFLSIEVTLRVDFCILSAYFFTKLHGEIGSIT